MDVPYVVSRLGNAVGDLHLDAVSARQHGLVLTEQLRQLGLGSSAVSQRVRRGRLFRVYRGVFAVGRSRLSVRGQMLAAVLAAGDGALLADASALELWGALQRTGSHHVCLPRRLRNRPGLEAHEVSGLTDRDRAAIDFIPLTAPARSLLDFAAGADPGALETALNEARAARLLRAADLADLRARTNGHRGWGSLNRILETEREPGFSRSEAERQLHRLIREAHLPEPRRNVRVHGWEVDMHWPEQQLVVEVDGYAFHSSPAAFERDRRKQAELIDHGLDVLRFTWRQIAHERIWLIARVATRLARTP